MSVIPLSSVLCDRMTSDDDIENGQPCAIEGSRTENWLVSSFYLFKTS